MKKRGFILAALAAALYGTNPVFAVPLYHAGMNPLSVLLFRYLLGMPLLAALIIARSEPLLPRRGEAAPLAALGLVMAVSSLALFESYNHMNPGLASTLLFMYPVLTALIMGALFHEPLRPAIGLCLVIMGAGLYLLMAAPEGAAISPAGLGLVLLSALTYAIYLVMARVWRAIRMVPTAKSLMYQLLFGSLLYALMLAGGSELTPPRTLAQWLGMGALVLMPTLLSLVCTIRAIESIGPTPTAIFGALEPITAVALGAIVLGERVTPREMAGGSLVLLATMLVVAADRADALLRRLWPFGRGSGQGQG